MLSGLGRVPKKQRPGDLTPGVVAILASVSGGSDTGHVRGARTLGAVHHIETDLVTLREAPETLSADLGVVHEDVRTTITRQETKTLRIVEPLDGTFVHETQASLT